MIEWDNLDKQIQKDWDDSDKGLSDIQKENAAKAKTNRWLNSKNPFAALIRSKLGKHDR